MGETQTGVDAKGMTARNRRYWLWLGLALLSDLVYLGVCAWQTRKLGFPLDDAWIHQVYARNLGTKGQLAFNVGEPSSGSTAPLWSGLLAVGYAVGIPPLVWAYMLATGSALLTAVFAARLYVRYCDDPDGALWVGAACLVEWHLAWAAVSGMEITLYTALTLLFLDMLAREAAPERLGLVTGLMGIVRPEGLLLGSLYGVHLLKQSGWRSTVRAVARFALPLVAIVIPLGLFNWRYGGRPFPNTMAAKYGQWAWPWSPLKGLQYLGSVAAYFAMGPLLLLLPFAVQAVVRAVRARDRRLVALAWMAMLILVYAVTMPAIYHHGRYLMPLIPLVIVLGVGELRHWRTTQWTAVRRTIPWLVGIMFTALWLNGATTYALQVRLLEEQHAAVGHWVNENTPADAVVASHDIGLLGYWGKRRIVDLVGLVTPEAISIMHDQQALADLCRRERVSYLVVFPSFHQELIAALGMQVVYEPPGTDALYQRLHIDPLVVYGQKQEQ